MVKRKLMFVFLLVFILCPVLFSATCNVNGGSTLQKISGFGASSAWSEWSGCECGVNSFYTANAAQFFSVNNGIGLSIIRARIPPDTGQWGSTAAPLQAARDQGVTQIMATAWTPPASWKSNGAVDNANGAYLLPQYYQNYADYLVNYVNTMKNSYNVTIYAISPANEPDYQVSYDGCTWSGTQLRDFVKNYLGPAFTTNNITAKIMIPESYKNDCALADATFADATARNYIFAIAQHFYGGGPTYCTAAGTYNKEFWETEKSSFEAYDATMTHGLTTAYWIHQCLVNANFNAFLYWWLAADQNNEGLRGVDNGVPKRFWTMGNYSKFIRPGYNRITCDANPSSNVYVSAYKSSDSSTSVIVAINRNTSAVSMTFSLSGITATSFTPWITSSSYDLAQQGAVTVSGGSFTYNLPAQSVVSFVGAGSIASPTVTPTQVVVSTWRVVAGRDTSYTDSQGNVWLSDRNYSGGTAYSTTNTISNALPGASDQALYQTERYGNPFTYTFNVPAGTYQVTLKFAETYFTSAGQRSFNVSINGTQVLTNFDIYAAAGGGNIAIDRIFNNITPSGGTITIQFGPAGTDNAKICAIQIIPQPVTPTVTRMRTMTFTGTRTGTPTWTRTATGTSTRTNTVQPTNTWTWTQTVTSTMTWTSTGTLTWTNTMQPTETFTGTWTNTPSLTVTDTISSNTPTITQTWTVTSTLTWTRTGTPTYSRTETTGTATRTNTTQPTSTFTWTRTPSLTVTDTISSNTPTVTQTWTLTASSTMTWTMTATRTSTGSVTRTNTMQPTGTFTWTRTMTQTWTMTNTRTSTPTPTFTQTVTRTVTRTFTQTNTPSFTMTVTLTRTHTATLVSTKTITQTATSTVIPDEKELKIEDVVIYPNPYNPDNPDSGDLHIGFEITQACKIINVRIYTSGFRLVKQITQTGNYTVGRNVIDIESRYIKNLANGSYFVIITAINKQGKQESSKPQILIKLR
ncbi:MAG: hypothetical protein KA120_07450 [Candidatus Goldbacteria bacterium]|nr:hypothetical protein [Candidatus Goldiibacteriota bacterium]